MNEMPPLMKIGSNPILPVERRICAVTDLKSVDLNHGFQGQSEIEEKHSTPPIREIVPSRQKMASGKMQLRDHHWGDNLRQRPLAFAP